LIGCSLIAYFVIVHNVSVFCAIFGTGQWGTMFIKNKVFTRKSSAGELPEEELIAIFEAIDEDNKGTVEQNVVIDALANRRQSMVGRTRRASVVHVMQELLDEHENDGDEITKADFQRLVHTTEALHVSPSGPEALRRQSVMMMQRAGYHTELHED
jgi:hypothetical protein